MADASTVPADSNGPMAMIECVAATCRLIRALVGMLVVWFEKALPLEPRDDLGRDVN
jgi:hypothetical protein